MLDEHPCASDIRSDQKHMHRFRLLEIMCVHVRTHLQGVGRFARLAHKDTHVIAENGRPSIQKV